MSTLKFLAVKMLNNLHIMRLHLRFETVSLKLIEEAEETLKGGPNFISNFRRTVWAFWVQGKANAVFVVSIYLLRAAIF